MANRKATIEVMEELNQALNILFEEIVKALKIDKFCDWLESRLKEIIGK